MRTFIILLIFVVLIGCDAIQKRSKAEQDYDDRIIKQRQQAIDACIKAGGIPFHSAWDGRMIDCKFPPKEKT